MDKICIDTVIIGAGIYGQLTALKLAKNGLKVALLDNCQPGHSQAASSGVTRVAHSLYDNSLYVDLAKQSLAGFRSFCPQSIYAHDAVLFAENCDPETYTQKVIAGNFSNHQALSAKDIMREYLGFKADSACVDTIGGVFQLEHTRTTINQEFKDLKNINFQFNSTITEIIKTDQTYKISTKSGQVFISHSVVIAAGIGSQEVVNKVQGLEKLNLGISIVNPGTVYHFAPRNAEQRAQAISMPSFAYIERGIFGIPMIEGVMESVKIAGYFDPNAADKRGDEALSFLKTHIPFLMDFEQIEPAHKDCCLYDYTKDGHFIVGNLKDHPNLYLACGWNGGGYKFSYALTHMLCASILTNRSRVPVEFSPKRLIGIK